MDSRKYLLNPFSADQKIKLKNHLGKLHLTTQDLTFSITSIYVLYKFMHNDISKMIFFANVAKDDIPLLALIGLSGIKLV